MPEELDEANCWSTICPTCEKKLYSPRLRDVMRVSDEHRLKAHGIRRIPVTA